MRPGLLLWLIPTLAIAADPLRVAYQCTEEDAQSFGLDCSEDRPCPVFAELAAADALGSRIFLTGNLHAENVTLYGLLLTSDDGGKNWTEPLARMRAAEFDQIQFADLRNGWIGGVMLEPLPRDPFLLATADGGATWRKRPLFDETRFGSIEQFWFDSASSGELIVDRSQGASKRFERYQSRTGGDEWAIVESDNKPLRLSTPHPRQNPSWRVRVDSASKTYRVERAALDNKTPPPTWEPVATFAIAAGECK